MKCRGCGSDDIIKASAFYEQSTTNYASRGSMVGVGVGGGGLGAGVGTTATYGTGMSLAAQRLAPPGVAKPSSVPVFALVGGGLLGLVTFPVGLVFIAAAVAFALWFSGVDNKSKRQTYSAALAKWNLLWYCKRCGLVADGDVLGDTPALPSSTIIQESAP